MFPSIINYSWEQKSGAKGCKIELFWAGFKYFTKKLFPRINYYSWK